MRARLPALLGLAMVTSVGCAMLSEPPTEITASPPETYSLFGEPLYSPALAATTRDTLETRLARAQSELRRNPGSAEATIWVGRRLAYLGRYRAAVAVYTEGIAQRPDEPRLYRHRGHRYITLRRFDSAIGDLQHAAALIEGQADEVEPDGIPNARNTPTSTLHSNVWYHLGLAYYLSGNLPAARRAYESCLTVSRNPDQLCATTYWLWHTLVRMGQREEAARLLLPIRDDLDVIENLDYLRLLRLYRGRLSADTLLAAADRAGGTTLATVGYGVAGWRLAQSDTSGALALMRTVVRSEAWPAFGHIAAEAELERAGLRP